MKMKKVLSMLLAMAVVTTSVGAAPAEWVFAAETATTVSNETPTEKNYVYGTMNIPYGSFYKAELGETNKTAVDAVTSATTNKWKNQKGTYTEAAAKGNGGTILGVEYYVAIERDTYEELKSTKSALLNTFTEVTEIPATYKVMDAAGNFSQVQGKTYQLKDVAASLTTKSKYGDYQLNMTGLSLTGTVYGVIVETTDKTKYALRHLENIWRNGSQLSWSTGFSTKESHGNQLSYDHYASMMGKTIAEVSYICDDGIYTIKDINSYIPVKYNATFEITDSALATGTAAVTMTGFPTDGSWKLDLPEDLKNASYRDNAIFYSTQTLPGSYTVTAKDESNVYAETKASFIVKTDVLPVQFENGKIAAGKNASETDLENFIKNISSVDVKYGEKTVSYAASGRGSVRIIDTDGLVKMDAASKGNEVFAETGIYELTVNANGYPSLTFAVEKKAGVVEPTAVPTPTKTAALTPTNAVTKTPTPTAKVKAPKKASISKVTNIKGRKIKVIWKKDKTAAGYQVQIAANKKFAAGKKTYTIKKASITSKTITKLKKKKTYYVRVRSYKKSGSENVYGKYSSVKKVRIKK